MMPINLREGLLLMLYMCNVGIEESKKILDEEDCFGVKSIYISVLRKLLREL